MRIYIEMISNWHGLRIFCPLETHAHGFSPCLLWGELPQTPPVELSPLVCATRANLQLDTILLNTSEGSYGTIPHGQHQSTLSRQQTRCV